MILKEGPYDSPNFKHVKLIKNKEFLRKLRHEILARLFNGLCKFTGNDTKYCSYLQDCLKDYAKSIKIIGGFLTKFAQNDSDVDINVMLKKETLDRISPDHETALEKIQDFFRDNINGKPISKKYHYVINYFFLEDEPDWRRFGIELYGDEIKKREVEDELDQRMVDVTKFLSFEKFEKYIFKPMREALEIVNDMVKRKKLDRCSELKRIYSIVDRVGGNVWSEFKDFPEDLTIYHYTADNLRYKAMNEESDFKKFIVLCEHENVSKLENWLKTKKWKIDLEFEECLNHQIVKKVLKGGTLSEVTANGEHIDCDSLGSFLREMRRLRNTDEEIKILIDGIFIADVNSSDTVLYGRMSELYKTITEKRKAAKVRKGVNAYRTRVQPFSQSNYANDPHI